MPYQNLSKQSSHAIARLMAVSYTHLDVYKRQQQAVTDQYGCGDRNARLHPEIEVQPVSYTHLRTGIPCCRRPGARPGSQRHSARPPSGNGPTFRGTASSNARCRLQMCIRDRLKQRGYPGYLHMIDHGATATWEYWSEIGRAHV